MRVVVVKMNTPGWNAQIEGSPCDGYWATDKTAWGAVKRLLQSSPVKKHLRKIRSMNV